MNTGKPDTTFTSKKAPSREPKPGASFEIAGGIGGGLGVWRLVLSAVGIVALAALAVGLGLVVFAILCEEFGLG